MNNPGIIIILSSREISIYLSKDKGESAPLSLFGDMPVELKSFGEKEAAAPEFKIGKNADDLFRRVLDKEVPGWLEDHSKEQLPVTLLLDNDIDEESKKKVTEDLIRWGYENVKVSRSDTVLFDYLNKEYDYDGLVAVNSDGRNLYLSLFSVEKPTEIERKLLRDAATDNRVEAVAAKIWEQVSDFTLDLNMENELPALRREAESFLSSGRSEKEGNVRLSDGDTYTYFLNRHMLKDLGGDEISLDRTFTDILLDNGMHDRSRMAIVLRSHAVGSFYLKENLTQSFDRVYVETGSVLNEVLKWVASLHPDMISENINALLVKEKRLPEEEPIPEIRYNGQMGNPRQPSPADEVNYTTEDSNDDTDLIPVSLSACIKKEKAGMFKKKNVLFINIDFPETNRLKWASVLCVQEKPLKSVEQQNIVKRFDRDDKGPFTIKVDLPIPHCPDAKKLRIYFKPDPDEPVGINNAYLCDPCTINLD